MLTRPQLDLLAYYASFETGEHRSAGRIRSQHAVHAALKRRGLIVDSDRFPHSAPTDAGRAELAGIARDANDDPVLVPPGVDVETFRLFMAGRVPAPSCGHYIAASEARAGFECCERCAAERSMVTGSSATTSNR